MKSDTELESVAIAHQQQLQDVQKRSHHQQQHLIASSSPYHSDIAQIQVKSHHQQNPTSKNLKNGKEKSKRKDIFGANNQPHNHHQETTTALAVVQQQSSNSTTSSTTTGAVIVNNSASIVRIPILDLQQVEKKKKKKQLAPIITNLKNSHHQQQQQAAIIMSSDNHHHNLREETASPTLVVDTKPKINQQQHVNNTNNLLNNNPTLMLRQTLTSTVDNQSSSTVVRSGSVSSGLDIEEDSNNMNEQQFESPASTPRMFSPSSTLNFGDVMSPRESPHLPQPSGQLKQSDNVIITPPILVQLQQEATHVVSEHETAVDLSSIETHETHDSEHTNVHSSKTSGSVNNSSPALVENNEGPKRHSTRSRSNSAKSSQFNRPLERAHTAPNIITKKQGEKLPSKSSSRLSNKYGQSEYKTYIKHTLKLKEVGDMRVRGISLKYETNYHEFLEEAIPHKAFVSEMNLLNQFLKSNEPGTKYCCLGFTFFCCTLGLSMLPFAYQLSHFETAVRKYLDELNKKYASAHISWKLVPSTTPSDDSYILVSLEKEIDVKDLEKLEIS